MKIIIKKVAFICGSVISMQQAFALPLHETEVNYYQNETYATLVGYELITTCWGRPHPAVMEGQRTPYAIQSSSECTNSFTNKIALTKATKSCYADGLEIACPQQVNAVEESRDNDRLLAQCHSQCQKQHWTCVMQNTDPTICSNERKQCEEECINN